MAIETKPTVTIISHTLSPESVVADAARVCYASRANSLDKDSDGNLIRRLRDMGHMSPLEHVSFTFLIDGISRACSHQLVRHRVASYSQRSQRYVTEAAMRYVVPEGLRGKKCSVNGSQVDAEEYFCSVMDNAEDAYNTLNVALGNTGEPSNELARSVLPNATATTIMVTMNARSLIHFLGERLCNRCQDEIQSVAGMMLAAARGIAPNIFDGVGPKCIDLNRCPEGNSGCGKLKLIRETYGR